jgi:hypothetical protein
MKPIPLPLGLQSSPGRTGHDGGGRLINAYAERADDKGKAVWPVWAIEGLRSFATLADGGAVRGAILMSPYAYVVAGTNVYRVGQGGGVLNIGSFPGSAPVYMARNRKASTPQVMIVSEGLRYLIENDTVATIADTDLPNAIAVTQLDGYFVAAIADGRFFWSSIDEGTTWAALDFATAEASPDGLNGIYTRGSELILFGTNSIEFWASTGAPFARIPGTLLRNLGLLCRYSVRDLNDVVFFIASDGTVRRLNGYSPERVSNHDIERAINSVEDKATITAMAYSINGHQFYVISCASWTWAYDATSGLWHERQSYGETRWRAEAFVDLDGVRVVGDFEAGLLYEIDPNTYDENGSHLVWTVRTPPVHAYPNRLIFDRLFLDLIPGVGLNSGDDHDDDPQVMLRWSNTGTKTWSNQRTAGVGEQGQFNKRVKFERLGETGEDGRVFEISMSAAVVRGLTGGAINAELLEP